MCDRPAAFEERWKRFGTNQEADDGMATKQGEGRIGVCQEPVLVVQHTPSKRPLMRTETHVSEKPLQLKTGPSSSAADRVVLRDLAKRVAEIAASPEQKRCRAQALAINQLTARRPSELVIPEGAWPEVMDDDQLQCKDGQYRGWERALRRRLLYHEWMGDDTPVDDLILVGAVGRLTDWGVTIADERVEARGCVVEFILKDTHTVENDPTRFQRFVKIAREEIARHYSD
jgi:hypothetical protein